MSAPRWIALPLALCAVAIAQTGVKISPRDNTSLLASKTVVRRFCEMDAQGFRLASDTAKRMLAVTTQPLGDEWHGFDVISEYQIGPAKANTRGVAVTVTYHVLGRIEVGDGYTPDPRVDTMEIEAVPDGDDWKVVADDLRTPRVRRFFALKWLHDQQATEKDAYRKTALEQATRALQ